MYGANNHTTHNALLRSIRMVGALRTPSGIFVTSFKACYLRCTELEPGVVIVVPEYFSKNIYILE